MSQGGRLGQIDTEGNKLVAQVDEFYLGRVEPRQTATAEWGGKTYNLQVAKIYPQVRNGTFEVDFHFVGPAPADVPRGPTLQTKLTLGDPAPPLPIPHGAFHTEPAGRWGSVVTPPAHQAPK